MELPAYVLYGICDEDVEVQYRVGVEASYGYYFFPFLGGAKKKQGMCKATLPDNRHEGYIDPCPFNQTRPVTEHTE